MEIEQFVHAAIFATFVGFSLVIAYDYSLRKKPTNLSIPPQCKQKFDCSGEWLSKILGVPISKFSIQEFSGGYMANTFRIQLSPSTDPIQPTSLVVKYCSSYSFSNDFTSRMRQVYFPLDIMCTKEVNFYSNLRPLLESCGVYSPKPYFRSIEDYGTRLWLFLVLFNSRSKTRMLLLLEDLKAYKHYPMGTLLEEDKAMVAIKAMVQMHGSFWNSTDKIIQDKTYISPGIYDIMDCFRTRKYITKPKLKPQKADTFCAVWEGHISSLKDPKVKETLKTLGPQFDNFILKKKELFQHKTFVHGDYHPGNMFFKTNGETENLILIDWSFYGVASPSVEFAYFLDHVKFDPLLDQKLMETYHKQLIAFIGSSPDVYPFEHFKMECHIMYFSITVTLFKLFCSKTPEEMKKEASFLPLMSNRLERFVHIFG